MPDYGYGSLSLSFLGIDIQYPGLNLSVFSYKSLVLEVAMSSNLLHRRLVLLL